MNILSLFNRDEAGRATTVKPYSETLEERLAIRKERREMTRKLRGDV